MTETKYFWLQSPHIFRTFSPFLQVSDTKLKTTTKQNKNLFMGTIQLRRHGCKPTIQENLSQETLMKQTEAWASNSFIPCPATIYILSEGTAEGLNCLFRKDTCDLTLRVCFYEIFSYRLGWSSHFYHLIFLRAGPWEAGRCSASGKVSGDIQCKQVFGGLLRWATLKIGKGKENEGRG